MVISQWLHKGRFILICFQPFCPLLLCLSPFLWLCGVMGSPKCLPFPPIYEDGRIDTSRLPFISVKSVFFIISGETVVAVERIACVSVRVKPSWARVCFKSFYREHLIWTLGSARCGRKRRLIGFCFPTFRRRLWKHVRWCHHNVYELHVVPLQWQFYLSANLG